MKSYLRPTAFVDTPVHFDGQVARLAGGMTFFSAYEIITVIDGQRTARLVPLDRFEPSAEHAALHARIIAPRPALMLGPRTVRLDQPQVMGIVNMTPDSFSDGGKHDADPARAAAIGIDMAAAGAAIIDVGGESTRPGATPVWEGDEVARTQPVIQRLSAGGAAVSIDTRKASVMEAALSAGATIVNDVSALLFDAQALALMARSTCPVILMQSPDAEKSLHDGPAQSDPLIETYDWLEARIAAVGAAGIDRSRIIVDPGIGFGKSVATNLAIINGLSLFHGLGCPILLGASRKRFIGALSNEAPVADRLGGSVAVVLEGARQGVQILRVHDVPETIQALHVWRGLRDQALS
ncbi:dihydropteroate synthase [Sphingomonas sp.]|uniref:dihydropteroate synthase n=1 Tax=Sphingomonas sp. TaxID=28214 RepID=UPI0025F6D731|nr:dihydropteroate synthase [Sphingomonas sp.]